MKAKVKKFFNYPIILALLFNLGVLVVLVLIACPKYSTDIDILMQSILYGIGSWGPETHLIYTNILVGMALKGLLTMAAGVAWYSVMQFVLVFIGLFSMTYVFLRRSSNLTKRLIILFFLCFMGYECYLMPSYIKTTVILSVAAFCMLADALTFGKQLAKTEEKPDENSIENSEERPDESPIENPVEKSEAKSRESLIEGSEEKPEAAPNADPEETPKKEKGKVWKVLYVWSAVLFWFGSMISFRIFLVSAVLCVGGILILYLGKKKIKINSFGIVAVVIAAAAVVCSQGFDYYRYSSDEVYAVEKENAQAIEKMYAFGYASYTDEVEEITGLTSKEYSALTSGRFVSYDDSVTDNFREVSGIGVKVNGQNILKFFRTVPIRMFQYALFFCCVILVALAYLSVSGRKNRRILVMPVLLWLASYLILYFGNAWSGSVVRLLVLLPICALAMLQYEEIPVRYVRSLAAFTCIFALIMYTSFHSKLVTSVVTDSIEEDYMSRWESDKVYAIDALSYLKQFSIFQVYPERVFDMDNISIVDGIYRDVRGFENHIFVDDAVLEKNVAWYNDKPVTDILIGEEE